MDIGTVSQHCSIILLNVGIVYVLGMIFVRVIECILPRNKDGWVG